MGPVDRMVRPHRMICLTPVANKRMDVFIFFAGRAIDEARCGALVERPALTDDAPLRNMCRAG